MKYTWWGGVLGPKLMNLYKCESCRFQFNRATGKGASKAIWTYNIVALVLALVVLFMVRGMFA